MQVRERRVGDVTILELEGRLVLDEGSDLLRERIHALADEGRARILLDLAGITYIDSCGVGVLLANFVSVRRQGGDLRLVHLTPRSRHILEISKLMNVFRIFDSETAAVESFAGTTPA